MSHRVPRGTAALALAVLVAGCGGKPSPEEPFPTTPVTPTWTPPPAPRDPAGDAAAERRARLEERIHFGFDRADLSADAQRVLDRKADLLRQSPGLRLLIEGHADERGSDEYNLALGTRRAAAAKQFLVNRGVDPARLEVASHGEEQPLDRGHHESAWAANRRAEFQAGESVSAR